MGEPKDKQAGSGNVLDLEQNGDGVHMCCLPDQGCDGEGRMLGRTDLLAWWMSSARVGRADAAHPPPSAFTNSTLASIRRRLISTWLRSLSRYSVWAVMTWR